MLRMLTGLAMSPLTLALKILAHCRRNRAESFRAESFRVSYMSDMQYRVRVEFHDMRIDLPSDQAGRLASALQEPGSDGPISFGSRQGLHWLRWHQQSVRIQRPAEAVVEEAETVSGIWLDKRSAINLGVAIEALPCFWRPTRSHLI